MSARLRLLMATMAVVVLIAGCGGDDASDEGEGTALPEPANEEPEASDTDDQATSDDAEPAAEPTETPTSEPEPTIQADPVLPLPDAPVINQITDTDGGGARPLLAWEPVDGAATYYVIVYAETAEPYWAAVTTEPDVYVGGPLQIPDDRDGPRVADGYTWAVYADDTDGTLLASSPLRSISP